MCVKGGMQSKEMEISLTNELSTQISDLNSVKVLNQKLISPHPRLKLHKDKFEI